MTETTERQEQVGIRLTPEQARWLDRRAGVWAARRDRARPD